MKYNKEKPWVNYVQIGRDWVSSLSGETKIHVQQCRYSSISGTIYWYMQCFVSSKSISFSWEGGKNFKPHKPFLFLLFWLRSKIWHQGWVSHSLKSMLSTLNIHHHSKKHHFWPLSFRPHSMDWNRVSSRSQAHMSHMSLKPLRAYLFSTI